MTEQLIIFDTTLRDGEQSPGASMTRDEKMRIANQLERRFRGGESDCQCNQGFDGVRPLARQ